MNKFLVTVFSCCLFCLLLLSFNAIKAQSVEREVVASSGDFFFNNSVQMEWTIGETMTADHSVSSLSLSQGFHQYYFDFTGVSDNSFEASFRIFPNPTKGILNIEIPETEEIQSIRLIDILGNDVTFEEIYEHGNIQYDLSSVNSGMYILVIESSDYNQKTHRIIKE